MFVPLRLKLNTLNLTIVSTGFVSTPFFYLLRARYIHVYITYERIDCEFLNFMLSFSLLLFFSRSFLEKGYIFNELFV